jgi:hypothetical protein
MTQETQKMTAVEWLQERYNRRQVYEESIFDEEFEQAKAMEKEQILNASRQFADYPFDENDIQQYYNETYNK